MPFQVKEREEMGKRRIGMPSPFGGSKLLGQLGQGSLLICLKTQHGVFPVNSNKHYGATQANKLKTRPGFAECLQSHPVFARFTC